MTENFSTGTGWVVVHGFGLSTPVGRKGRHRHRLCWTCCETERPYRYAPVPISSEGVLHAERAARAHLALTSANESGANVSSSTDLCAFLAVKGVSLGALNPWDVSGLRARASGYLVDERAARVRHGEGWDGLSDSRRTALLHGVCNAEGDATYIDPKTGYTVFSAHGHLRRGFCCGTTGSGGDWERTHRCRHCPYADDGQLNSPRWVSLHARIAVIDRVREMVQRYYEGGTNGEVLAEAAESASSSPKPQHTENAGRTPSTPSTQSMFSMLQGQQLERPKLYFPGDDEDGDEAIEEEEDGKTYECRDCKDKRVTLCTRCAGWRFVLTPEVAYCPQCGGEGVHACLRCTPWRPPVVTHFAG